MIKRKINLMDYAKEILQAVNSGVMITTKDGDKVNSMTISWGTLGYEWGVPIFTTFVRTGRFTHEMLEKNPEFTVNIPYGAFDRNILGICGTKSGRNVDKVKAANLTLVDSDYVSAPGLKELPLTLECRVVYKQHQDKDAIDPRFLDCYPQAVDSSFHSRNRDFHTAYYGEIVGAYIIEE